MAGGSGTRLWPLSRKNHPKQFQALVSDKTLLEETFARVCTVVAPEHIFVSTTEASQSSVATLLPEVPKKNILVEPLAKNTAPAISLSVALIASRIPNALIATVASDHTIVNENEFTDVFNAAFDVLKEYPDTLVTIGINPTRPDTGFGYIQMGDEKMSIHEKKIFTVANFQEKPDLETAKKYLADWSYLWNAGYFIFSAQSFLHWCESFTPEIVEGIEAMLQTSSKKKRGEIYNAMPTLAVEPAIIEKLSKEKRFVIPSALEWSDVGNWSTLLDELQKLTGSHSISGSKHLDIGSRNLLVKQRGDDKRIRFIGTIGLEDVVIVDTGDALLVANKETVSSDIKDLLEKMKTDYSELL